MKPRAIAVAAMLAGAAAATAFLGGAVRTSPAIAQTPSDTRCAALASLKLPNVEVASATAMAEGAPVPSSALTPMFGAMPVVGRGLPAFCRIVGHIRPAPTSDIGFEVWLPANGWDGRLHGIGIGGFAGAIDYYTLAQAIKAGQASVATDTGHRGNMQQGGWAKGNPEAVRDYSWRAIHLSTVAAKRLLAAYYGRPADKSYFVGCSGGGRQGLVQAARFPEDYDGIVAGAPAASFTELAMGFVNVFQAQAPQGAAIGASQVKFLEAEVLAQCDAADGQKDGLVADPRQCRFDAAKLSCRNSTSPQCFTDPQIAALQRIHAGPRNSAGRQLAGGYLPSGSEAGDPAPPLGWDGYLLSDGKHPAGGRVLVDGMLDGLIQRPFATVGTFDFDRDPARLRAQSRELDAPANLGRFFARGGRLIIWHDWADGAIPPENTLRYHAQMMRLSGPRAAASVRLFMVPGVQHCFGGKGPDSFGQAGAPAPGATPERNMVMALQQWTEARRPAPEMLVALQGHIGGMMGASAAGPERQRLLCAWPGKAVLTPGQDPAKAASYSCR